MNLPVEMLDHVSRRVVQQQVAIVEARLQQQLDAERAARAEDAATIERLKREIAKLTHDKYGTKSEHSEQLESVAAECEPTEPGETVVYDVPDAAAATERRKPARRPFPSHLPRERVVIPAPSSCPCCGGQRLSKLGEDITETLEVIPRQLKVVQTVREKFTCRDCETISQAPAPFHAIPRAFAGPSFLAMIAFEKYAHHQPLNRQAQHLAREGIDLSVSTLVGLVGATANALMPLHDRLMRYVMRGDCIHGDDTTVLVLDKGKARTGRIWTYVRDERPFGSQAPPAVIFAYSPDRRADHVRLHLAGWQGTLHSDAYAGYGAVSRTTPSGTIRHAYCWAHARRQFFKAAVVDKVMQTKRQSSAARPSSPIAREAVDRIDRLFAIERKVKSLPAAQRLALRREHSAPHVAAFGSWMREQRTMLSKHADAAKAMDYLLTRWDGFTAFLDDGRIELDNNGATRR